ncbi:type 4a pilus biogenesis protein PilO [Legionella sp. W05-934-2]|jgi:type IV pilus assembly protein PilO|uniref:type 4a pilus biogenesis protein PilO n=1 Tax=Legionella sp. W05-934-2 TaxID=1198649 RepID=UPI0034627D72
MADININELTLDNIGQWPAPVKYAICLLCAIFVIAIGYWVLIKPSQEQYGLLQQQETELKREFERKQRQAVNLTVYKEQLVEMQKRFGQMLQQLPAKHEMPGLLEDISKTGLQSGLSFELFAPQAEQQFDFYIELPIKITVVGSYHQLAIFLSRIAQLSRIVTLHDFVIEKRIKRDNNQGELLVMSITAKIYRYRAI